MNDLKYAVRQLMKNPGFTCVSVLTLGVCLSANLAIFAVIDSVLLRPLPFPEPDRLVTLFNSYPKMEVIRADSSYPNYYKRRGNIAAFSHLAGFRHATAIVGENSSTEVMDVCRVSPDFFATLGIEPTKGRGFTEEEMTFQTDVVVILTDRYWRERFNADPNVIGRSMRLDGDTKTIVGVLPPKFRFLSSKAQIFRPLSSGNEERDIQRLHTPSLGLIARLKPGAGIAEAQSQIDRHDALIAKEFPDAKLAGDAGYRTVVKSLHADHVASIRPTILLMQAGVLCLLLIGVVNLVNLLLIRASGRVKEMAIRQSLGARAQHVVKQVMFETLLLTFIGGLFGLAMAAVWIRLLPVLGVEQLPLGSQINFNWRQAIIAFIGAIATGVMLGVPIVWFNLRGYPARTLQSESRGGTTSYAAQRLRHGFIIAQIALAFMMLAGAGLLGVSLSRVMAVSPGFRPDHVLTGKIKLTWKGYPDLPARIAFTNRLLAETTQLPGMVAVGVVTDVPVNGGHDYDSSRLQSYDSSIDTDVPINGSHDYDVVTVDGHQVDTQAPPILHPIFWVAGDYFKAMGISLREGRYLESEGSHLNNRTCVVDEDFARSYWPQGTAIGKRVFKGSPEDRNGDEAFTIVGVVAAVKQAELTDIKAVRAIYFPYGHETPNRFFVVARTESAPESLSQTLQRTVRNIDSELMVYDIRSMDVRIADSLIARRSPALLAGIFACGALLLAAIGIYGVLSFAVSQRRREIGVRVALGADPGQIRSQFLILGLRLMAVGVVIGVLGAWLAGRAMQSVLFNIPSLHLTTLAITAVIMTVVSLVACLLPTIRASRVQPMDALRSE